MDEADDVLAESTQTLESDCLGSDPPSAICQLCDLGQDSEYLYSSISPPGKRP